MSGGEEIERGREERKREMWVELERESYRERERGREGGEKENREKEG